MTFDDITSKVRKISMDTVAEVQKMNEVRQLNSNINAEKKKIHSLYAEMGKKLYDRFRENPPEEFEAEFAALKSEFEAIEGLREQVRAKKGVTLCPNCKMEVGEFERFCSNCGCKMPEVFKIEEEEPAGELETDESAAQAAVEEASEPDASEETAEPEAEKTETAEPEAEETETAEPEAEETETAEPEAEETETAEPEAAEMETAEPEAAETKITESVATSGMEPGEAAETIAEENETDCAADDVQ